ncbi:PDZ domain-containing protein [Alienimonas californiensis]|uniref:Serine endoprotease n=1 Tax=Alienimonas californiensis TaxID=2527989 RepID=A0A517P4M1_9PLAN|nr:PDZ domain-containing protein [Alienimonas californiensis]QDT14320.1 serine endoprotease [Alienimonas californiensis]
MHRPPVLTPALAAALLAGALAAPTGFAQEADGDEALAPLIAPRPARQVISEERIAAAIEELAADDWATREAASRLLESAPAATDALRKAATDADPERRARSLAVLSEGVWQSAQRGDVQATAAFVDALAKLIAAADAADVEAPNPEPNPEQAPAQLAAPEPLPADLARVAEAAGAAKSALGLFPTSVTPLAIAEVRRNGAAVMRTDQFNRGFGPAFGGGNTATWSITLDDRWTGGEEGLQHLRSIAGLNQVHLTDDCPIPEAARAGMVAGKYGDFAVERRGKAFLGVSFPPNGSGGCQVDRVTAGGPASRAGLRPGDLIVQFGDTPINTPAALLDAIREEGEVGEATPVTVLRAGQKTVIPVTLDRWPDRPLTDPDEGGFGRRPQPLPQLVPPADPFDIPADEAEGSPDDAPLPPFSPDRPAERVPGDGAPADLGDTED